MSTIAVENGRFIYFDGESAIFETADVCTIGTMKGEVFLGLRHPIMWRGRPTDIFKIVVGKVAGINGGWGGCTEQDIINLVHAERKA